MDLGRFSALLVVGAPGSGKGTQAQAICCEYQIPHVATGDLLREHRRRGTPLGIAARTYMDSGDLVPDELVVETVVDRLALPDAARGVLLDGFPRTLAQAEALDAELVARGGGVRGVLFLDVPESSLIARLTGRRVCLGCRGTFHVGLQAVPRDDTCPKCGDQLVQRPDDRASIIRRRVAVYREQTWPVIEYYGRRGLIFRIDGDRDVQAIQASVRDVLRRLAPQVVAEPPLSSPSSNVGSLAEAVAVPGR